MSIQPIVSGETIKSASDKINANFEYLASLLNGGITGVNFRYLGGTGHGDLSYVYDSFHSDQSVLNGEDTGLDELLDDVYERISGIAVDDEHLPVFLDSKTDPTTYSYAGVAFSQVVFPATEITIPANAAPYGIIALVRWSCLAQFGFEITLALRLNGTDLTGARWVLKKLGSNVTGSQYVGGTECNLHASYLVADGWDGTVENKIRMGTMAGSYFKSRGCTLTIFALR